MSSGKPDDDASTKWIQRDRAIEPTPRPTRPDAGRDITIKPDRDIEPTTPPHLRPQLD